MKTVCFAFVQIHFRKKTFFFNRILREKVWKAITIFLAFTSDVLNSNLSRNIFWKKPSTLFIFSMLELFVEYIRTPDCPYHPSDKQEAYQCTTNSCIGTLLLFFLMLAPVRSSFILLINQSVHTLFFLFPSTHLRQS